jgi:hypothetical protein
LDYAKFLDPLLVPNLILHPTLYSLSKSDRLNLQEIPRLCALDTEIVMAQERVSVKTTSIGTGTEQRVRIHI